MYLEASACLKFFGFIFTNFILIQLNLAQSIVAILSEMYCFVSVNTCDIDNFYRNLRGILNTLFTIICFINTF